MMNVQRQLAKAMMAAINGGAITAPTLEPALKIPKASERSLPGNHSETTLAEPENRRLPRFPIKSEQVPVLLHSKPTHEGYWTKTTKRS